MENYLITFSAIALVGLLLIIVSVKFNRKARRFSQITGTIIFHIGAFGILYQKVSITLFISLVLLFLSVFILIDPIKISNHINKKFYKSFGILFLLGAIAFCLMYLSKFPAWLWVLPALLYLTPYLIPPLKKHIKIFHLGAWVCILAFVSLIIYAVYLKYYQNNKSSLLTTWFAKNNSVSIMSTLESDQKKLDETLTQNDHASSSAVTKNSQTANPLEIITPPEPEMNPSSPLTMEPHLYVDVLKEADEKFLSLKQTFQELSKRNQELEKENADLKRVIESLQKNE